MNVTDGRLKPNRSMKQTKEPCGVLDCKHSYPSQMCSLTFTIPALGRWKYKDPGAQGKPLPHCEVQAIPGLCPPKKRQKQKSSNQSIKIPTEETYTLQDHSLHACFLLIWFSSSTLNTVWASQVYILTAFFKKTFKGCSCLRQREHIWCFKSYNDCIVAFRLYFPLSPFHILQLALPLGEVPFSINENLVL